MKRTSLLLALCVGTAFAQQTKPIVATSAFYDVDDANNRAFLEFTKNSTKKLVEALMKEDPAIRSVILSSREFTGNPAPPGRYRLVSLRDGCTFLPTEKLAALCMKATGMSYDDYLKKAASLRKTTGSSLRVRVASTSGDKPASIAEGDVIRTDLMKIQPDRNADYYDAEQKIWLPMQMERVKSGAIKSWSLWAFQMPSGAGRPYDAVTSTIYKDLESAMANPGYAGLFAKAHTSGNYAGAMDRTRTVRTIVRSDIWRVVWAATRQ